MSYIEIAEARGSESPPLIAQVWSERLDLERTEKFERFINWNDLSDRQWLLGLIAEAIPSRRAITVCANSTDQE